MRRVRWRDEEEGEGPWLLFKSTVIQQRLGVVSVHCILIGCHATPGEEHNGETGDHHLSEEAAG